MTSKHAKVIRGGTIVDGTGSPRVRGDVRIEGARIVGVGTVDVDGAEVIDADGLCVSPGFIDPHTHYDAQVVWDPDLTPSSWHGVTSVVMGNCGFGVAPTRPEHRDLILQTLENVEGMSLEALRSGVRWEFESFAEYLALLDRTPRRLNVGAMVGHTPLRLYVMGPEAAERAATQAEIDAMVSLATEAMAHGALGIATSRALNHAGAGGLPVPSRLAAPEEIEALAAALATSGRGTMSMVRGPDFDEPEDFARLATISGRPMTWLPLFADGTSAAQLDAQRMTDREVWPQMACRPIVTQVRLLHPSSFASHPSFRELFARPEDQREGLYRDQRWRAAAGLEVDGRWHDTWGRIRVKESTVHADLIDGPSLLELATARGQTPWDVMVELSLDERLDTRFEVQAANIDEDEIARMLAQDDILLGLSDAGAHSQELCDAGYATHLLGHWVRERGAIDLETGVRRLTGQPAQVFRLEGRGELRAGNYADIVLFDPDTVANLKNERVRDLPNGEDRLVSRSVGIEHVLINGVSSRIDGEDVPHARAGQLLQGTP